MMYRDVLNGTNRDVIGDLPHFLPEALFNISNRIRHSFHLSDLGE